MIRNILALLGLLSVALVTAVTVDARSWNWNLDEQRPPSMRVSFADLDLASPGGQRVLDRRIRSALDAVCGRSDIRDLHALRLETECRRNARRATETQVAAAIDRARTRQLAAIDRAPVQPVPTGSQ